MEAVILNQFRRYPATLEDVAKLAGVSPATVSRVTNNSGYVKAATRVKVEDAIKRTGYIAVGSARALKSQRSHTIGVLVPSLSTVVSLQTIDAFHRTIERAGYSLLVSGYEFDPEMALKNAEMLVGRGIDGLFIISLNNDEKIYELLRRYQTPFLTNSPNDNPDAVPFIGYDAAAAGRATADFICGLGHRDIAFVSSEVNVSSRLKQRVSVIKSSLAKWGVELGENFIEVPQSENSLAGGREALRRIQSKGRLPSAILASNDLLAAGIVMEANRQGIEVPQEMSVIGYGDMDVAEHITPSLTTLRTPKAEIGEMAAEFLLAKVEGRPAHSITLDHEVIVRESTSKPKSARRSSGYRKENLHV
jgi:LacI family transcriptional regulator